MVARLFAYGSLMWPDILQAVAGRALPSQAATLRGYRRFCVRGASYPALRRATPDSVITGVVYEGLCDADWQRLDAFEGADYQRQTLKVGCAGRTLTAAAYLWRDAASDRLADADWSAQAFTRKGLGAFRNSFVKAVP